MRPLREPTPTQLAALQAALLDGGAARKGWTTLNTMTNELDSTDAAAFRMLPMVYRNLTQLGFTESELGPLKGIYRQAWYRNQIATADALRAVDALREASIEPIALKGFGLIASIYPESAVRPLGDIDLLIRPHQVRAAVEALFADGFNPSRGSKTDFIRRLGVFHAMPLVGPNGTEVDIHRAMLEENLGVSRDIETLSRVTRGSVGGTPITTVSPEDHVLNACVHGARWDWSPVLRWVPDTVWCVRTSGSFDWGYVESAALRRGVTQSVGAALSVARDFESSIPSAVVNRLLASPKGQLEKWDFRLQQAPDRPATMALRSLSRYARMTTDFSARARVVGLPTYYEWIWELDRPRQVPVEGMRRIWKRLRSR